PAAGGAAVPLTVGPSASENQKRDIAPAATAGDGCLNSLDRQQEVLIVLGLAQSGPAGGPTVLNLCPTPRPESRDNLLFTSVVGQTAVIDPSIERSVRIDTTDGARGAADVTIGVEMDAVGDETKAMFTLNFDPAKLSIDAASFPSENADITLGEGAPRGTTIVVNASEARLGRITLLVDFNGPVPSGTGKRMLNLTFRTVDNAAHGTSEIILSDAPGARQIVNGSGEALTAVYPNAANVSVTRPNRRRWKEVASR